jgi:hypothetical protein
MLFPVPFIGSGHGLISGIQEVRLLNSRPPFIPTPARLSPSSDIRIPACLLFQPIACQYSIATKIPFIAASHPKFAAPGIFLIDGNKLFFLIDYIVKFYKTRDDKAVTTATIE